MKTFVMGVAVVLLAGGVGAFRAVQETRAGGEHFVAYNPERTSSTAEDVKHIIAVNGAEFEFGMLQRGTKMNHDFILKNVSDHPIEIWVGSSSCTCTVASLGGGKSDPDHKHLGDDTKERKRLEPGDETEVTMEWEGTAPNPKFFQTAEIHTDDPQQKSLQLKVSGYVQSLVHIRPDAIQMNSVSVENGALASATIYSVLEEFPEVEETEFMVKDTADFFDIEWVEVTEKISEMQKSARRLIVRAKPGLPIGTVNQRLRLKVDLKGENTIYVPITAKVESELSILGSSEYSSKLGVLRWGVVAQDSEKESTLYVLVKGDAKESVKLELDSMEPEGAFDVEVFPPKNPKAITWTVPIKVRLRTDAPIVSRLGKDGESYGVVRLKTGHPVAKELQFRIQFAVN